MKMNFIWEPQDIICGLRIKKLHISEESIISYMCTADGNKYSITSLSDGMVIEPFTDKQSLCDMLNNGEYIPLEIVKIVEKTFKI